MKRKGLMMLMCCVLCLAMLGGCNGGKTSGGGETSDSTLKEPEVLEKVVMNIADNLNGKSSERVFRGIGRTFIRNGGLACDFSCTGVKFNALCKGEVFVKFSVSAECYFTVYVNGVRQTERLEVREADTGFRKIAEFDTYGEYEIEVVKQSQYPMAYCEIKDVKFDGSFGSRPKQKNRFIEFYGDSIMNGSNIYKGGTSAATSDATYSFGYMTARALNADCNVIGRGGMALHRNNKTDGLLEVWELCGGVSSPKVQKYDFARVPDCVVVEIGTNDYLSSAYTDNFYSNNVKEMVFNLRSVYGSDVKIVWCYGFNSYVDDIWNVTKSTLDALNSDGTIYYCEIPECGLSKEQGGDGLHPDVEISKTMTSALKSFIEENIYK
jgi:hypothetical protein